MNKWSNEEPECVSQILEAGYNEGVYTGYIFGGLALIAAGGIVKLMRFIKRK